jgi:Glycosyltransferase family 87
VTGFGLGLLVLLVLGTSGLLVTGLLDVRAPSHVVLATYVVVFAEIVGLSLFLSAFDGLTRPNLIGGAVALFVAVVAVWVIAGLPRPFARPARPRLRNAPAPVVLLGAVIALALAYVVALILFTPPNGWDPLNYHLSRVAFWVQSHHIGYIEPTYDERLNLNPPNGEIGFAFVFAVTRDEVFVGFVQFFAALACAAGVYALARRVRLSRVQAAFGSLLFLSLPIVILQASLGKNDLVVASFLLAAAVFVLGDRRRDIGLAAVATALAVGTKSTATYGVVLLLGLALLARGQLSRLVRVSGVVVGAIAGSYWYVVNAVESGRVLGDQSAQQGVTAPLHGAPNVVTAYGTLVDLFDVSGARGRDILLYAIAAMVLAGALFAKRRATWIPPALAGGMVASPLLLLVVSEHVGRPSLTGLYDLLGKPMGYLGEGNPASPTTASDTASWFGPVGFLFILGAIVAIGAPAIRRAGSRLGGALGLAPVAWFVLVALTLTYNPWLGRFFIFPVALTAALWGRTVGRAPVAWGAAVLGALTVVLALVHYVEKPMGIRLLDRTAVRSVWSMPRWEVQSLHAPEFAPLFRFVDEQVPAHASVALALADNGFGYPAFGPHLDRHVVVVPFGTTAHDVQADWLVANPDRTAEIDRSCWQEAFNSSVGSVFRHGGACG